MTHLASKAPLDHCYQFRKERRVYPEDINTEHRVTDVFDEYHPGGKRKRLTIGSGYGI
jgi:hypothetical protein